MKKIWEVLEDSKKYLASSLSDEKTIVDGVNKSEFICHAVMSAQDIVDRSIHCRQGIPLIVHTKLGGKGTFVGWLMNNPEGQAYHAKQFNIVEDILFNDQVKIQALRLKWLNELIAEYKAKDE